VNNELLKTECALASKPNDLNKNSLNMALKEALVDAALEGFISIEDACLIIEKQKLTKC